MAFSGWHAHIYFDADQLDDARALASAAAGEFDCSVGRYHTAPVGPHPRGSVQLTLRPDQFGRFATWAPEARGPLTIFAHGLSGDELDDHKRHVVWFGPSETLDLSVFD